MGEEYPIKHMVLFMFKPDTGISIFEDFKREGEALTSSISRIDFKLYIRKSFTSDRTKGFNGILYADFKNADDFESYKRHTKHVEFVAKFKPHFEDVIAADINPEDL